MIKKLILMFCVVQNFMSVASDEIVEAELHTMVVPIVFASIEYGKNFTEVILKYENDSHEYRYCHYKSFFGGVHEYLYYEPVNAFCLMHNCSNPFMGEELSILHDISRKEYYQAKKRAKAYRASHPFS